MECAWYCNQYRLFLLYPLYRYRVFFRVQGVHNPKNMVLVQSIPHILTQPYVPVHGFREGAGCAQP